MTDISNDTTTDASDLLSPFIQRSAGDLVRKSKLNGVNMPSSSPEQQERWQAALADPRTRRQLVTLLGKTVIFTDVPESFLHIIVDVLQPVDFSHGAVVYRQGEKGDWMGILLNGRLSRSLPRTGFDVQLGTLGPGDIFGDLGMFGLSLQRSFTIRAELASTALVISNSGFMEALDKASDNCRSHQVFSEGFCMKGLLDDAESFLELACFRKLDRNFVLELREASEPRLCYPNQTLMKQGQLGDEMYIIRAGSVRVEKDKKTVVELPSGTVVGELAVLGTDKRRTATVKCQTLCLIRALHADVFHEIVNKFPRAKRIFEHAYVARLVSVDVQNTKEEKLWLDTFFGSAAPLRKTEAAALIGEIDLDEELQKDDSPSSPAERVQQAFRRYPTGRGAHMTGQMTQGQRKSVKMHDLYPNLPSEPMHSEQDDGVPDTDED